MSRLAWIGNLCKPLYPIGNCQHKKACSKHLERVLRPWCHCKTTLCVRRTKRRGYNWCAVDLSLPKVDSPQDEYNWIQSSIRNWLDEEWQPQSIHEKIGQEAATLYLKLRQEGEDHIGSLVLGLSLELEKMDFQDAFVDAFTVANKVAELVMEKRIQSGVSSSGTDDTPLSIPTPTIQDVHLVDKAMSSEFERYQFLAKILDETISDSTVHAAVLICLGYQFDRETGQWLPEKVDKETSRCLEEKCENFDILHNEYGWTLLEKQLPQDEDIQKDLDEIINQLAGDFYADQCRKVGYQPFLRRAIVVKWLYYNGKWMA